MNNHLLCRNRFIYEKLWSRNRFRDLWQTSNMIILYFQKIWSREIFLEENFHDYQQSRRKRIWKYFLLFVRISSSLPTRTLPQYENILFSIKYWYTSNNFYAILARCWGSGLGVWFNLLGLKLLQCLDSLFFWILRNYTVFILTIHFWPSPQKLFKLFLQIALKNCLAIV